LCGQAAGGRHPATMLNVRAAPARFFYPLCWHLLKPRQSSKCGASRSCSRWYHQHWAPIFFELSGTAGIGHWVTTPLLWERDIGPRACLDRHPKGRQWLLLFLDKAEHGASYAFTLLPLSLYSTSRTKLRGRLATYQHKFIAVAIDCAAQKVCWS